MSRIAVLGSGRAATALGGGLRLAGQPVCGLWGRRREAAEMSARAAGVPAYADRAGLADISARADVLLVAVSDRAIPVVAQTLADAGLVTRAHVVVHTSGAASAAEALAPLSGRVRGRGTLHLLRAISSGESAMHELAGGYFGVEGDEQGQDVAAGLGRALGGRVFELRGEGMALYHAAAAMASNYAVALLDVATELAGDAGVPADLAREALAELAAGSLAGAARRGTSGGLTGPIRRSDRDTVAKHLRALSALPETREIYAALGRRAVALTRRAGDEDRARLAEIEALLATPSEGEER